MDKGLKKIMDTQPDIERRTFAVKELRAATKNDKPTLEGLAAVFNEYSEDLGGFMEIIDPGFFDEVLDNDVRSLVNHDPNYVLGRTKSGTLEIEQRAEGLFQRTYPPVVEPDATQWARDLMASIRRGDIDQMSFGFIVKSTWRGDDVDGDEWYIIGEQIIRRLKKGGARELLDVSVVTYPAYPQTSVSANARSRFTEFQKSLGSAQERKAEDGVEEGQASLEIHRRRLELAMKDK